MNGVDIVVAHSCPDNREPTVHTLHSTTQINDFECSMEQATLRTFVAALLSSIRIMALANKIVKILAR